jgi:Mce-associated membrane protein
MAGHAAAPDEVIASLTDEERDPADAEETERGEHPGEDQAEPPGTQEAEAARHEAPAKPPPGVRLAIVTGLVIVVALTALTSWFGYRAYESHQVDQQRKIFLQVARQGALNLTTIDWHQADADVQRILDSATGTFYDDFQRRAQPFIHVVQQVQSKSEGAITEAGIESMSGDQAQVLAAVTVKTSVAGAADPNPRAWRMRITVQKVGDEAKVADVEFVP